MAIDFSDWSESNSPSDQDSKFRWRIRRTSHLKPMKFAIASVRHLGMYTHYYKGRTGPHFKTTCAACLDGMAPRWTGFVLARLLPSGESIVFQFPGKCAVVIEQAEEEHNSLRGLVFQASRPGGRENSPVALVKMPTLARLSDLPEDEEIRPILAHIWGFRETIADKMVHQQLSEASEAERVAAGFKQPKINAKEFAMRFEDCDHPELHNMRLRAPFEDDLPGQLPLPLQGIENPITNGKGDH